MNRRSLQIVTIAALIGLLTGCFGIRSVYGSGIICIAKDGSISPPTSPIMRNGDVYTFTGNIFFQKLVVEKNDIVVDGAGHTIEAKGTGMGVLLSGNNNVTIRNMTIKSFEYGVFIGSSNNITISSNNIEHNSSYGVMISNSSENTISTNNINENGRCGVYICGSAEANLVYGNSLAHNDVGVQVYWSGPNNTISENVVTNGFYGIWFDCSSNNMISRNNVTNNSYGIRFNTACNNYMVENNVVNCSQYGISVQGSSNDNTIYHNNLVENQLPVESYESTNAWNVDGEGNYWSDHGDADVNHDGIGDEPVQISEDNADHYPLCGLFLSFNTTSSPTEVVSNSTVTSLEFFSNNGTIRLRVSNSTADQNFGFCRISIPHDLINPLYHPISVMIDEGETATLFFNDTLCDDGTCRWIYVAYEHPPHEITVIPEFSFATVLMILMAFGLVGAMFVKRKNHRRPCSALQTFWS